MMKATYAVANPDAVELTLTVTMRKAAWDRVAEAIYGNSTYHAHAHDFARLVREMTAKAHAEITATSEVEG